MVTWLPTIGGVAGSSEALGVSPDGVTVVGKAASNSSAGYDAFTWTAAGGMVALPSTGQGTATEATNGGTTVAGFEARTPGNFWGRYWVNGVGNTIEPVPGGSQGSTFISGVSHDGSVIVGDSPDGTGRVALKWTAATGSVALPRLSGGSLSVAYAVSGDGSTIVGNSNSASGGTRPVRWTSAGISIVGDLPGGTASGTASGVSPDGSIIVGYSSSTASGASHHEAFRWTEANGMQPLGMLGRLDTWAYDVSADGDVVVGRAYDGAYEAFIWTPATGMLELDAYLASEGVPVGTSQFFSASGVSDDGLTIVGVGRQSGSANDEAFVITVPEPASPLLMTAFALGACLHRHRCCGERRCA